MRSRWNETQQELMTSLERVKAGNDVQLGVLRSLAMSTVQAAESQRVQALRDQWSTERARAAAKRANKQRPRRDPLLSPLGGDDD